MSTTPEPLWLATAEHAVATEELVRASGVSPFASLRDLPGGDPFDDDEEYEAFLADLYASRRAELA